MGNKTGKFNVPTTTTVNKDEAVINEHDVKVEDVQNGDTNGEHINAEINNAEEKAPNAEPKKKNVMSWLKKVSIRKEKKPKVTKENGVKEDAEILKENGDVEEVKNEESNNVTEEIVTNGHKENHDDEEVTKEETEVVEETLVTNGHDNGTETSETHTEEH